jgi:hypothetical protein
MTTEVANCAKNATYWLAIPQMAAVRTEGVVDSLSFTSTTGLPPVGQRALARRA